MRLQAWFASGRHLETRDLTVQEAQDARDALQQLTTPKFVMFPERERNVMVQVAQIEYISIVTGSGLQTDADNPSLPTPNPNPE